MVIRAMSSGSVFVTMVVLAMGVTVLGTMFVTVIPLGFFARTVFVAVILFLFSVFPVCVTSTGIGFGGHQNRVCSTNDDTISILQSREDDYPPILGFLRFDDSGLHGFACDMNKNHRAGFSLDDGLFGNGEITRPTYEFNRLEWKLPLLFFQKGDPLDLLLFGGIGDIPLAGIHFGWRQFDNVFFAVQRNQDGNVPGPRFWKRQFGNVDAIPDRSLGDTANRKVGSQSKNEFNLAFGPWDELLKVGDMRDEGSRFTRDDVRVFEKNFEPITPDGHGGGLFVTVAMAVFVPMRVLAMGMAMIGILGHFDFPTVVARRLALLGVGKVHYDGATH